MCGLVGVITKRPNGFTKDQQDLFSNLLFIDVLRGHDATGVFVVSNQGDVFVAKDQGHSLNFIQTREYQEAQRRAWNTGACMIGHNRAATRGSTEDKNAHPFNVDDNIILVHNGTMRGSHKKHADVEVDSHAIAHLIHESNGDVAGALSKIDAAYALIWYNVQTGELNMIRNDERPLFWMELDEAWVWCSEVAMMEFAAKRCGLTIKVEPTALPINVLQKFTLDSKQKGWVVTDEKVDVKKPLPQYTNSFQGDGGGAGSGSGNHNAFMYADGYWEDMVAERPPFRPTRDDLAWEELERQRAERHAANFGVRSGHPTHGYPGGNPRSGPQTLIALPPPKEPASRLIDVREPPEFSGTEAKERAMCLRLKKSVTRRHFTEVVAPQNPYNTGLHVQPFDYGYVNTVDGSDGYYLYACPFDDDDIVVRHFFPASAVTEERMIQLAGTDYIFEFRITNRQWFKMDLSNRGHDDPEEAGFVIFKSSQAKMLSRMSGEQQQH